MRIEFGSSKFRKRSTLIMNLSEKKPEALSQFTAEGNFSEIDQLVENSEKPIFAH